MGGWKAKVAVAAIVLILGVQTALLFRQDRQAELPAGDIYHEELVLKKHTSPHFLAEARPKTQPIGDSPAPGQKPSAERGDRRFGDAAPLISIAPREYNAPLDYAGMKRRGSNLDGDDAGPPQISLTYPGTADSLDDSFSVNWPVDAAHSAYGNAEEIGTDRSQPITHIVADGDTLMRLAARYFGDAARQAEIFEANRSVLASPDVLPIGARLVVPSSAAADEEDSQWRPIPTAQN